MPIPESEEFSSPGVATVSAVPDSLVQIMLVGLVNTGLHMQ